MSDTISVSLKGLAEQINAEHREVVSTATKTLEHATKAGNLLRTAKDQLPHGQFKKWVADNFAGSYRTAADYMRIASFARKGGYAWQAEFLAQGTDD